jgi:DNA adenine methylase
MKPLFKYQGGKSREMKFIRSLLPSDISRAVEPFSGSAAFSVNLELPAFLGDTDQDPINVFQVLRSNRANELKQMLEWGTSLRPPSKEETKEDLKKTVNLHSEYYRWRDTKFDTKDPVERAFRFVFLRQLCFSGMVRTNSKTGISNVPFGWYTGFKCGLLSQWDQAVEWAMGVEAQVMPWAETLYLAKANDFVFLDPPYLNRLGYASEGFDTSVALHQEMADILKSASFSWLLVHVDCPEYREMFSWASIEEKPFSYSMNFKGRDSSKSKVGHLYIRP